MHGEQDEKFHVPHYNAFPENTILNIKCLTVQKGNNKSKESLMVSNGEELMQSEPKTNHKILGWKTQITNNDILTSFQSGFIPGDSTVIQLAFLKRYFLSGHR